MSCWHLAIREFSSRDGFSRRGICFSVIPPKAGPSSAKGGFNPLLSCVVMLQSYDYFSSSVPFFQIPDSLRDLTQPVTLVDDRCYLSCLHEFVHHGQVLFAPFRNKRDELPVHEP